MTPSFVHAISCITGSCIDFCRVRHGHWPLRLRGCTDTASTDKSEAHSCTSKPARTSHVALGIEIPQQRNCFVCQHAPCAGVRVVRWVVPKVSMQQHAAKMRSVLTDMAHAKPAPNIKTHSAVWKLKTDPFPPNFSFAAPYTTALIPGAQKAARCSQPISPPARKQAFRHGPTRDSAPAHMMHGSTVTNKVHLFKTSMLPLEAISASTATSSACLDACARRRRP